MPPVTSSEAILTHSSASFVWLLRGFFSLEVSVLFVVLFCLLYCFKQHNLTKISLLYRSEQDAGGYVKRTRCRTQFLVAAVRVSASVCELTCFIF